MTDHPSSSAPSARGRSRRKEARPAELLEAATRLFVEKGYAATKVEEVAALAQVSKGTLFLYYPSKQALLKAVVRENIAGRFAEWQAELEAFAGTTPELVRYAFQVWQERIGDTYAGGICKLMASECCNFPELASFYLEEVVEPGNALVRRILERGVARGELRPLDLDAAIHLITTPMFAYIHWRHSIGMLYPQSLGVSAPLYFQTHVDNLLRGLSATAPDV
ncbi:TetR/AcrR family transcriptional regulator [Comamonas aquatica]|uniref:TetR family transcriptional regulator n=2 Tax=Comamonas aquatica TaxID=225991 RepID=A0A014MUL4_9BURK|nr:TetR/AcrR family transcriptional regulator [Comamonas aquatica]EXU81719.1 TetR family transcriptional regulator [Comamonas aquatica DA1877]MDH0363511.1 TetR/AcrR family transcriptional regulator [Comamonas aquatica]MDH0382126.1 TetR/AcrR family transcriptional regulator [Comamonas aquatica]MDH0430409.1 TetR/AcrR family transcriptional regulator [Comamonas aquatica]MDH0900103.1 TetR/AcrR family transcriptional regulator [Comamonas aquatica]